MYVGRYQFNSDSIVHKQKIHNYEIYTEQRRKKYRHAEKKEKKKRKTDMHNKN